MAARDGLKDPKSDYKPSGSGLKPSQDYALPSGKPEPPTGSIDFRSAPQGSEEQ